jgi:hypothetical protein
MGSGSEYTGFIGVISGYTYKTGELGAPAGLTVHMAGMLVDRPGTPCVGGGDEVKVVSVETRGQLDAGWLVATHPHFPKKSIGNFMHCFTLGTN